MKKFFDDSVNYVVYSRNTNDVIDNKYKIFVADNNDDHHHKSVDAFVDERRINTPISSPSNLPSDGGETDDAFVKNDDYDDSTGKNNDDKKNYGGKSGIFLNKYGLQVGDTVKISTLNKENYVGIILPRYETFSDEFVVIKLKNGYNVGILIGNIINILKITESGSEPISPIGSSTKSLTTKGQDMNNFNTQKSSVLTPSNLSTSTDKFLPKILLISTGGTIASKIDYRTGGVTSVLNASDLYSIFPELSQYGNIQTEFLFNEYSENLNPQHWSILSQRIFDAVQSKQYDGIIISHGTDTMHYTSAALSFTLENLPIPVVLVGSQRSSDRPSSDAFSNLIGAMKFIKETTFAGIFISMHHNSSDEVIDIHLGTRVRKNHTSKRDAFKSLDSVPFAHVEESMIKYNLPSYNQKKSHNGDLKNFAMKSSFDNRVILIKYFPGFDNSFLEMFLKLDYKVIILEGTGLGHINKNCFPMLRTLINSGVVVFMTSQCIFGRVNMAVYDTGRDLLDIGVIPLSDMSSETAVVKAMWALGNSSQTNDLVNMMTQKYANELSDSLPIVN